MPKLSEGQRAVNAEAMALLTRAETHLDNTMFALKNVKITVDEDSFRHIRYYLDKLHAECAENVLRHINAVESGTH